MKKYSLPVTYKCDWKCSYCSSDTHNQITPPFEVIKERIETIEDGSEVSLTGGEPGYAKMEVIDYAVTELRRKNCLITVNTNGAFFVRYPEYCDMVNDFFYHCSEDLDIETPIYIPDERYKVDYMLVVTDENCSRLDYFIETYPNIKFLITKADATVIDGIVGPSLSVHNAIKIYNKHKANIDTDFLRLFERCGDLCEDEGIIML